MITSFDTTAIRSYSGNQRIIKPYASPATTVKAPKRGETVICSRCGHIGPIDDFTKGNEAKGNRGRCRQCKAIVDAEYRVKKEAKALDLFILKPDMLNRDHRPRIGVLMLSKIVDRRFGKAKHFQETSFGLKAVLNELTEPYEVCYPELINNYEYILISITSVMDIENLIYTFEKHCPEDIKPTIIIGGFGVINIGLITKYIDVAVFGRAEGQIDAIISGWQFPNVWRKFDDPLIEGQYIVRQPQWLLPGENNVGCRNHCMYCQYAHIRQSIGKPTKYDPGQGTTVQETDWQGLVIDKPGRYTTAWDGWSQETRLRVQKPITDNSIYNKLAAINSLNIDKAITIKVFQIVGYPWETSESVLSDIDHVSTMLKRLDGEIGYRLNIAFLNTPFGPEPLTPMECEPANIGVNWNELISGKQVYYGTHIKAYNITAVSGPYALLKRLIINRGTSHHLDMFKDIAFNRRLKNLPERHKINWITTNTAYDLSIAGALASPPVSYLSTSC